MMSVTAYLWVEKFGMQKRAMGASTDSVLGNGDRERKVEALIKVRNGVVAYFSDPELQQST